MALENTSYVTYLIELSQQGRKNTFIDLCEMNLKSVFTVVYRLTKSSNHSTYITLKTFLMAWDNIKSFNLRHSFAQWLRGIAIRLAINDIFSKKIVEEPIKEKNDSVNEFHKIELAIMNLPDLERIIYVLYEFENYSYDEINAFFGDSSADEIKTILHSTREIIMKQIGL